MVNNFYLKSPGRRCILIQPQSLRVCLEPGVLTPKEESLCLERSSCNLVTTPMTFIWEVVLIYWRKACKRIGKAGSAGLDLEDHAYNGTPSSILASLMFQLTSLFWT